MPVTSRTSRMGFGSILVLLATTLRAVAQEPVFYFSWPSATVQCQVVSLQWWEGVPPFTLNIIPIYSQPMIYQIPDSAYANGVGYYPVSLQMTQGESYVVFMSDKRGFGNGGSSMIQAVGYSRDTSCLYDYGNSSNLDFTYTVSGVAQQCQRGFELAWTGGEERAPYNFTVIPCDQSFRPFDVVLEDGVTSMSDWKMNLTGGSNFTIMMNNALGYGRGGVAGIYSVSDTNDNSCVTQPEQPAYQWPSNILTNALSAATLPVTEQASENSGGGLYGGAIAGIVIGVIAVFTIVGLALWFLLRRKRRRERAAHIEPLGRKETSHEVDLADDLGPYTETNSGRSVAAPMIEPYRTIGSFDPPPAHDQDGQFGSHTGSQELSTFGSTSSPGFAGVGAVGAGPAPTSESLTRESRENDRGLLDEELRPSGPGVAAALPTKSGVSAYVPPPRPSPPSIPRTTDDNGSKIITNTSGSTDVHGSLPPPAGGMRISNPDHDANIPTSPLGAAYDHTASQERERRRRPEFAGPTFRRHEDAGRVPVTRPRIQEEEIVDLPPLYTDVPRDGPEHLMAGNPEDVSATSSGAASPSSSLGTPGAANVRQGM